MSQHVKLTWINGVRGVSHGHEYKYQNRKNQEAKIGVIKAWFPMYPKAGGARATYIMYMHDRVNN